MGFICTEEAEHKTVVPIKLVWLLVLSWILCADSSAEAWRFIMTSDSRGGAGGVNQRILSEIVGEIKSRDVDFVVFSGDLVYGVGAARLNLSFNCRRGHR